MVTTALLLVPLMLTAALAVDVGSWYARAVELQRAADAAALAGVVHLPDDPARAAQVAAEAARRNGLTGGSDGIEVTAEQVAGHPRDLLVTIVDHDVPTYFGQVVRPSIEMRRSSRATYLTPVVMGATRNFLGGGNIVSAASPVAGDGAWLGINAKCTHREHGDPFSPLFVVTGDCVTGTPNPLYRDSGYTVGIELPANRTEDTEVVVYDGPFDETKLPSTGDGIGSPGPTWPAGTTPASPTLFTLHAPDITPLDDTDNPTMESLGACRPGGPGTQGTKRFDTWHYEFYRGDPPAASNWTFRGAGLAPTSRTFWNLCTIPASAPPGRYLLRVTNLPNDPDMVAAIGAEHSGATNAFGVFAVPATNHRLCSVTTDALCPAVFGVGELSLSALMEADGVTDADIARIDAEYAGRTLEFAVFDLEGGQTVQILAPTGPGTWAPVSFDWETTTGASGTDVTSLNSLYEWNGVTTTMRTTVPPTYDPGSNPWWRIRYISTHFGDRTTWTVSVRGQPVHLIPL